MKAYYLGKINTQSGTLVRNREHDLVAGRILQLVNGDNDAKFAFFDGDISTILVAEAKDYINGPVGYSTVVAEIRSKENCPVITWGDFSEIRRQIFDTDATVVVEVPVSSISSGNIILMRQK